jgi:hypothetical protein
VIQFRSAVYALYKETINHATLPAEEAFSLPFGPFVEGANSAAWSTSSSATIRRIQLADDGDE